MTSNEKILYGLMLGVCVLFVTLALFSGALAESIAGLGRVQLSAARLINDFTVIGTPGGALLNAALMGLASLVLVRLSNIKLSGPTIAATMTIMGFSLFGKTPLNALPVMLGVYIASRIAGKPFRSYLLMAMFGTAIGPLVSFLTLESGSGNPWMIPLGIAAGILAGALLPALAMAMLRLHEGFNLYNMGLTCGFLGLFGAAVLAAAGKNTEITIVWNNTPGLPPTLLVPLISALFIGAGVLLDGRSLFKNLRLLLRMTGRLPSDFMDSVSPGAALVNSGILGLLCSGYLLAIGAPFNGPVLGGLLTVMGFATFGKHPRNCWPVMTGVILVTLVFGKSLSAPGPVLALLFGTTLAPLAGEFGPLIGIAAGFVHLVMVERTAVWHGGLDLYNNGFAGGLTATLFVACIQWIKAARSK